MQVTRQRDELERRHKLAERAKAARAWPCCPSASRCNDKLTQEQEIDLADYRPHVMIYFCVALAIGYGTWGFTTMRNSEELTSHLHRLHYMAFFAESAVAAVSALVLCCPGWHKLVIRRHYQKIAATLLFQLYSLQLV